MASYCMQIAAQRGSACHLYAWDPGIDGSVETTDVSAVASG